MGVLLQRLDKEKYRVINDVMLESDGTTKITKATTKSTQVDHVVVSIYGIFAIHSPHVSQAWMVTQMAG